MEEMIVVSHGFIVHFQSVLVMPENEMNKKEKEFYTQQPFIFSGKRHKKRKRKVFVFYDSIS